MNRVKDNYAQGELIKIYERGTYEAFILKCMERKCTNAQLEIADQTDLTMLEMYNAFNESGYYLKDDLVQYMKGARCTFPNYECSKKCNFAEGVQMTRKI